MPQSYARILLHIVFSTKARMRWIDEELQPDMHAYLAGVMRARGCQVFRVGGVEDHVHISATLPRTEDVASLVRDAKTASSEWVKTRAGRYGAFSWQSGYGAFSIGQSQLSALMRYIENQAEHHRTTTFREEFIGILRKYRIEFKEEYLLPKGA